MHRIPGPEAGGVFGLMLDLDTGSSTFELCNFGPFTLSWSHSFLICKVERLVSIKASKEKHLLVQTGISPRKLPDILKKPFCDSHLFPDHGKQTIHLSAFKKLPICIPSKHPYPLSDPSLIHPWAFPPPRFSLVKYTYLLEKKKKEQFTFLFTMSTFKPVVACWLLRSLTINMLGI